MPAAAHPRLKAGKVYRTADLRRWGANPTRLATRLEREGKLKRLGHGLFHAPETSRFGSVPPGDDALLRTFLGTRHYLVTGSRAWNPLGLGSTGVDSYPLVYNPKRSGLLDVGGRTFEFRRVRFPSQPPPEYFVVDLLENRDRAGVERSSVTTELAAAVEGGRFSVRHLREMAERYGSKDTQAVVEEAAGVAA